MWFTMRWGMDGKGWRAFPVLQFISSGRFPSPHNILSSQFWRHSFHPRWLVTIRTTFRSNRQEEGRLDVMLTSTFFFPCCSFFSDLSRRADVLLFPASFCFSNNFKALLSCGGFLPPLRYDFYPKTMLRVQLPLCLDSRGCPGCKGSS